jgi:hypothetical protein
MPWLTRQRRYTSSKLKFALLIGEN